MRTNDEKIISVEDMNSMYGHGELTPAVEDEDMLRDFLQTILVRSGYAAESAADARSLMRYAHSSVCRIDRERQTHVRCSLNGKTADFEC